MWAKWIHNPYRLWSQCSARGQNHKWLLKPCHCSTIRPNGYTAHAFPGVPNGGTEMASICLWKVLSRAVHKGGPQQKKSPEGSPLFLRTPLALGVFFHHVFNVHLDSPQKTVHFEHKHLG